MSAWLRTMLRRLAIWVRRLADRLDAAAATAHTKTVVPARLAEARRLYPGAPDHWLTTIAAHMDAATFAESPLQDAHPPEQSSQPRPKLSFRRSMSESADPTAVGWFTRPLAGRLRLSFFGRNAMPARGCQSDRQLGRSVKRQGIALSHGEASHFEAAVINTGEKISRHAFEVVPVHARTHARSPSQQSQSRQPQPPQSRQSQQSPSQSPVAFSRRQPSKLDVPSPPITSSPGARSVSQHDGRPERPSDRHVDFEERKRADLTWAGDRRAPGAPAFDAPAPLAAWPALPSTSASMPDAPPPPLPDLRHQQWSGQWSA